MKRLSPSLLALALAAACSAPQRRAEPQPAPPVPRAAEPLARDDELRPPEQRSLPLLELPNAQSNLVTFRVLFRAGSADDPAGRQGLTNLTAHVLAEGGTESMTFEALARAFFPMAARVAVEVDRELVVFTGQVHRERAEDFYALFRDMLLHPRFDEADFRRVHSQAQSALTLELRGNDDETLSREVLQSVLFAGHPYEHPVLGTERGLAGLDLAAVREWRGRVLCSERVHLGIAGNYSAALATRFRQEMTALPSGCAEPAEAPAPTAPQGLHVVLIDKPSATSTAMAAGHPLDLTRRDADFAGVQLFTNYVGIHRQSAGQLYQTIREARGLNYGTYAYSEFYDEEGGGSALPGPNVLRRRQHFSLWLRPVAPAHAVFALRAALRTVARNLELGIAPAEFTRTQAFQRRFVSLFAQTEAVRLGFRLDDQLLGLGPEGYAERMSRAWGSLTAETAVAAARRHLHPRDLWVSIVAPNARALAAELTSGAPSTITYDTPKPPSVLAEDRDIGAYPLELRPENVRVVPVAEVFR